jgi:hypothetical protein
MPAELCSQGGELARLLGGLIRDVRIGGAIAEVHADAAYAAAIECSKFCARHMVYVDGCDGSRAIMSDHLDGIEDATVVQPVVARLIEHHALDTLGLGKRKKPLQRRIWGLGSQLVPEPISIAIAEDVKMGIADGAEPASARSVHDGNVLR